MDNKLNKIGRTLLENGFPRKFITNNLKLKRHVESTSIVLKKILLTNTEFKWDKSAKYTEEQTF